MLKFVCFFCIMSSWLDLWKLAIFSQSMWTLNRFGPCPAIGRRGVVAALGLYLYPSHELVWLIIFQMRALSKWKRYRFNRQLSLVLKKHPTSSVEMEVFHLGVLWRALIAPLLESNFMGLDSAVPSLLTWFWESSPISKPWLSKL